jgi:hypothetical protein
MNAICAGVSGEFGCRERFSYHAPLAGDHVERGAHCISGRHVEAGNCEAAMRNLQVARPRALAQDRDAGPGSLVFGREVDELPAARIEQRVDPHDAVPIRVPTARLVPALAQRAGPSTPKIVRPSDCPILRESGVCS